MNRQVLLTTSLLCTIVLVSLAAAQEANPALEKRNAMQYAVTKFMAENGIPGASIAVVEDGQFQWATGFGMADVENYVPASSHTLYRLASISKSLTATAAMELWQRGKLDLDAPVQKYCPSFPQKESPITTRQVLGHLGGIRHYKRDSQDDPEVGNTRHFDDPIQGGLDFFKDDPLVSKPGTKFSYSTQGFTLVGCVIEGASGQMYVDFIRQNIFRPAEMTHSLADDRFGVIANRTRFYSKSKSGAIINSDFLDSSYKIPGGGWLSSAEDMANFEVAMLSDLLVNRSSRDLMWTSLKTDDGKETGYGLGWGIGHGLGVLDVGHGGGQQGTSTFMMMVPERRAGVVVLMNLDRADSSALSTTLMKLLLGISN